MELKYTRISNPSERGFNRVRMNNQKPHGFDPHFHLEKFNGKKWIDAIEGEHLHFFKNQKW